FGNELLSWRNQAIALKIPPPVFPLPAACIVRPFCRSSNTAAWGGRRHGQEESEDELPSPIASAARSGSLQASSAQQPLLASLDPRVRVCHRPVHRLVLLRATSSVQPHRRRPLPLAPGVALSGRKYD